MVDINKDDVKFIVNLSKEIAEEVFGPLFRDDAAALLNSDGNEPWQAEYEKESPMNEVLDTMTLRTYDVLLEYLLSYYFKSKEKDHES